MSVAAMKDMLMLPENRPAIRLLMRSTMAMAGEMTRVCGRVRECTATLFSHVLRRVHRSLYEQ